MKLQFDMEFLLTVAIGRRLRLLSAAGMLLLAVGAWADEPSAGSRDRFKEDLAGNAEVERVIRSFAGKGSIGDDSEPTPALEAVKLFETADDLKIELVASEPAVEQPLDLHFDDRGRMWVVQ
ncbi:MAG: L-sorbosone dehydrogenase, partial [Planctomycetaceae bacterium]